jgi:peptidoglycan/LPS O-acetylase OafA/YrhL
MAGMTAVSVRSEEAGHSEGHLYSLDLLRGLAALMVLLYHVDFLYGYRGGVFDGAYLCVDLFFLLSGYVIANAYDGRLAAGMRFGVFFWQRLARIWPLFALSTLLGVGIIGARLARDNGFWDISGISLTVLFNVLMLPSFFSPYGSTRLFPFNGATWSIFFEMVVNVFYAVFWRVLTVTKLLLILAVSGLWLVALVPFSPTLDLGWDRSHFVHGLARVFFSFFLGCFLFRLRPRLLVFGGKFSFATALMAFFAVMLGKAQVPVALGSLFDLAVILILWPLILIIALTTTLKGRLQKIAWVLGGPSYSVYLLQTPLIVLVSGLPQILLNQKIADFTPFVGVAFTLGLVILSFQVWRGFEVPVQRWLRSKRRV